MLPVFCERHGRRCRDGRSVCWCRQTTTTRRRRVGGTPTCRHLRRITRRPPLHRVDPHLFGHGLSYGADFKHTGLALSASTVSTTGTAVSFVQNNGTAAAEEVAQISGRGSLRHHPRHAGARQPTAVNIFPSRLRLSVVSRCSCVASSACSDRPALNKVMLEPDVARDLWLVDGVKKVVERGCSR